MVHHSAMIPKALTKEGKPHVFPLRNELVLRKAVSDAYVQIDRYQKDFLDIIAQKIDEVKKAECECCGLKEDCTQDYITKVRNSHMGSWVCGLCAEAVREKLQHEPNTTMEEAVSSHKGFCQKFNTTVRLNPKLSLTLQMRDIVKRSSESKNLKNASLVKLSRSCSCDPKMI